MEKTTTPGRAAPAAPVRTQAPTKSLQRAAAAHVPSSHLPSSGASSMRVSSPSDPAEREAVATARAVMRMSVPASLATAPSPGASPAGPRRRIDPGLVSGSPSLRRFELQRQGEGAPNVGANVEADIRSSMAAGSPLPLSVRRFMEPRFGADFGRVKVHTDERVATLNRQVRAQAFTVGEHIFFGRDRFRPDSDEGRELIAHELTHTVQQGAATQTPIRRSEAPSITQSAPTSVQRLGVGDALDYFARHANNIPGFRMFTIILGVNPINMSRVDRSAANILRAIVEFIPGGGLITQALDNHGVFDRVGAWVDSQIRSLGMTGSVIRDAINQFLDSLSWRDIFDLGGVWNRAKRIFSEPIDRIISFVRGLVDAIIQFIKDAILRPLAELASRTRGYDLLRAVLGRDPITGDAYPRNADTLIGGFMKLIGQEEIWQNIKRANAVARAWAWFQGALSGLLGFVTSIPGRFLAALQSLTIGDIVLLPRAFARVGAVFLEVAGQFMSWALSQVMKLLEIIFEVVAPGAMGYLRRAAGAFQTIIRNPIGFVGNLVRAGLLGFRQFARRFLTHLRAALIGWLTGTMGGAGVYIPQAFTLREIIRFVLSVLGLTWQNIRVKIVRAIGETATRVLETGFDIVMTLVTQGPAAAWEKIQESLTNLREIVMEQIMSFVQQRVVQAAITRLLTSLNPAGAFIQAVIAIYNTIMFFVERLRQIAQVAMSFINSISAIASGVIATAANRVESTMAGLLTLVVSFLARIAGLGRVSDAVVGIINRVRAPIDRALDRVVAWIVTQARRLGRMLSTAARNLLGQLFRRRPIRAGAESHTTWLSPEGEPMVASTVMPLSARIADWRSRLRTLDDERRGQASPLLGQAHSLRVRIATASRQVIAAQRAQDEAVIRARQADIEADYATLSTVLQQLFVLFQDVRTERGAAMDATIAEVFNRYDREVLPLKRGRPPLVSGSAVTIYSQLQALWNQDAGWAYQMAHGVLFQMRRVLESGRRVGTTTYPQLTGVEVRIPPYQRGRRTMAGTRVDYTEKDRALVSNQQVMLEVGVEVKRYGGSWDAAKVQRELGKISRQMRAQINSRQPKFDVIRLEIGGYASTPQNFRDRLDALMTALQAEATPLGIRLERRAL